MRVKANKTFAGVQVSMRKGDVKELPEGEALFDLLRCGYVAEVKDSGGVENSREGKRGNSRRREKSSEG